MGSDIHGVWQKFDGSKGWVDVPSTYEQNRHYQLFAVLAGVRNGAGFAGIRTGEAVQPISEPRGLPVDFVVNLYSDSHPITSLDVMDPVRREYHEKFEPLEIFMGDHSHSWLTGEEMLAWFEHAPTVLKTGILSLAQFRAWNKTTCPDVYCGGGGPDIRTVEQSVAFTFEKAQSEAQASGTAVALVPPFTHVACLWYQSLKEELAYFFDEVRRLHDLHDGIRFVFGFDS